MNNRQIIYSICIALVVIAFISYLFFDERERRKKTDAELEFLRARYADLEKSHWCLIESSLKGTEEVAPDLTKEFMQLRDSGIHLSAAQLKSIELVLNLLGNHELEKATDEVGRLVEDVLRRKSSIDGNTERDCKLIDLLVDAQTKGWLDSHSTLTLSLLKEVREKISSRLEVKLERWRAAVFIFSAIGVIYQLAR